MAFQPSKRRHRGMESTELTLTPVMNLMVVMIPMLLSNTQFIKIGVIDLNLPPAATATSATAVAGTLPKETRRSLDLTVSITDRGFYISSALAVLTDESTAGPTIPKKADGTYDFEQLTKKLYEVKQKAQDYFPDTEAIVIQAEKDIKYQTLVSTMDAARSIEVNDQIVILFPRVSLSAGVI
ncbi:MAG: biopolymer transporter ExbD [candidate division KSB1 bacterium]|nr:biopolymer transporter ExbD [candidate division KSB1 bacterium]MDZ7305236.1 biopolymer transporter ExbD [candidate division KSB1 bacterium]MDZ7311503.1 biopolymer transporter ExbD [candidate division KSB1 bacterium]